MNRKVVRRVYTSYIFRVDWNLHISCWLKYTCFVLIETGGGVCTKARVFKRPPFVNPVRVYWLAGVSNDVCVGVCVLYQMGWVYWHELWPHTTFNVHARIMTRTPPFSCTHTLIIHTRRGLQMASIYFTLTSLICLHIPAKNYSTPKSNNSGRFLWVDSLRAILSINVICPRYIIIPRIFTWMLQCQI